MKETQETTTETKTKGLRCFWLKLKTSVIQLQLLQSFPKIVIFVGFDWIKTCKDHWIHLFVSMKRLASRIGRQSYSIPDTSVRNSLDRGCNISNISCRKEITTNRFRSKNPYLCHIKGLAIAHQLDGVARLHHTINHPNLKDNSTIWVVY